MSDKKIKKLLDKKITIVWRDTKWVGASFTFEEFIAEMGNPTGKDLLDAIAFFQKNHKKNVKVEDTIEYTQDNPDFLDDAELYREWAIDKVRNKIKTD